MRINELLSEEITIGRIEKNKYKVSVYEEPQGNPSFHVMNKTNDKHCIYQIKNFELLEQKTKECFSNKELNEIKIWLKEKSIKEGFKNKTNWQVILLSWNLLNEKYQIKI